MITHPFGGGVYAKETRIPAGYLLGKHAHTFDHLSILASGSIELSVNGNVSVVHAPACLVIEANKDHQLRAITDTVWFCVHATDCDDPERVDKVLISKEA